MRFWLWNTGGNSVSTLQCLHLRQKTTINLLSVDFLFTLSPFLINLENTIALRRQSCFSSCNRRRSKSARLRGNADSLRDCLATPLSMLWTCGLWKDCNRTTSKRPPALYPTLQAKSANERNVFVFSPQQSSYWEALRRPQEADRPYFYRTAQPHPRFSYHLFLPRNSRSRAS